MRSYSFYVGTTTFHDAHISTKAIDAFPRELRSAVFNSRNCVYGVWEEETEETAIYTAELASDEIAQRIGYAIALLTGNDCVLVIRAATREESHQAMHSTARYRVTREIRYAGNRTLLDETGPLAMGYAFTHDVRGDYVAYLVNSDASISPVE